MPSPAIEWAHDRARVMDGLERHEADIREIRGSVASVTTAVAEIKASNRTWGTVLGLIVVIATVVQIFVR